MHIETATGVIREMQQAIERLATESDIQLQRIADLQAQLDVTLAEFRRLQGQKSKNRAQSSRNRN